MIRKDGWEASKQWHIACLIDRMLKGGIYDCCELVAPDQIVKPFLGVDVMINDTAERLQSRPLQPPLPQQARHALAVFMGAERGKVTITCTRYSHVYRYRLIVSGARIEAANIWRRVLRLGLERVFSASYSLPRRASLPLVGSRKPRCSVAVALIDEDVTAASLISTVVSAVDPSWPLLGA